MMDRHGGDASRRRRRQASIAVARSVVSATLLLVVYYWAPFDDPVDAAVLIWLVIGLAVLVVALVLQIRVILRSDAPRLRAMEAVAIGLPFLLLLYAAAYTWISVNVPDSFTEVLDRTDALYFTMTVFTTIGFGDIAPVTHLARIVTMTQMVTGLLAVGVVARLLLTAVNAADDRIAGRSGDVHVADADDR